MEVPKERIDISKWDASNPNWSWVNITHPVIETRTRNFLWGINNDFSGKEFKATREADFDHPLFNYKSINTEIRHSGYSRNLYLAIEKIYIPYEGRLYLRDTGTLRQEDADTLYPIIRNIIYNIYKIRR